MNTAIERCPMCNGVLAIIGRVHLCVPRADIVQAMTDARERELREKMAADKHAVGIPATKILSARPRVSRDPLSAQGAGPAPARPAKPRAKKGTGVYPHRDAEKRRAYLKEYMRKRRAKS